MFSKNVYLVFFILIINYGYSQKKEKLPVLLKKAKKLVEKLEYKKAITKYEEALTIAEKENLKQELGFIYKKIGFVYFKQKNIKQASFNFKKCIKADSLSQNAADSYFNLSLIYRKLKNKDSLLYHLDRSIKIYTKQENTNKKFNTYQKASTLYNKYGLYEKAINLLLSAYTYYEKENDVKNKASISKKIGITQRLMGNLEKSAMYYKKSLNLNMELNDTVEIANSCNSIANILSIQKKQDSAILYYQKAIRFKEKVPYNKELGRIWSNLASAYYIKGNKEKALTTYKKALEIKKVEKDSMSISYTYNELAMLLMEKKQYQKVKQYIDSSLTYLSTINNNDVLLRNIEIRAIYYKAIKNYSKSLELREQYQELYQTLYNEKQSKLIQNLQEKFESKLKQKKIHDLSINVKTKSKTIETQKYSLKQKNWFLSVLGILILGLFLYFKLRQKIKAKDYEVKRLESVFENQEMIKESIGRDLHDIVSSNYNGIRLKILALDKNDTIKQKSNEIAEELKQINHEIRLVSHRLSPLGNRIKETSLVNIINSYLIEIQYYSKIFIDIQSEFPKELNSMTLKSQTNFYGILLEVFNNITKHALATKIIITNKIDEKGIYKIDIQDNGKGFDNIENEGIGLINIKQRTQFLNGEITINSSNKGTIIELLIPININTDETT